MTLAGHLPLWATILVATCVLGGALLTLIGAAGLLRLGTFYERVHAPTLGTTLGTGFILIGSMLYFSLAGDRLVIHEVLIAVFVTMTTPVSLMLLVRAADYRDRLEGRDPEAEAERSAG
jgi:multicomponent K+:H+ antiporter subunit G